MVSLKKNVFLNVTQNICKVIFPLITIPFASRVLGTLNYGKVSFGNSIVRYFILFSALGISTYSQREAPGLRNDKYKINIFANQIFTINCYSTIISYVTLFILLTFSTKLQNYRSLILIQSASIILTTLGSDWVNVVYEDYFYITLRYIIMQCFSLVLLFLLVKKTSDYYMYALINIIATTGGNLFNFFYIRKYVKLRIVSIKHCIKHLKHIFLLFCVSITTVIYISSDITIIGYFLTDSDVAIYTMASNIYSVIKQIISAITVVSIPRMAYYLGNNMQNQYKELVQKCLDSLFSILIPIIVGLAFLSYHILNIMGGSEYTSGQSTLIVLAFALLFAILAGFYSNGYLLLVKQDKTYLFATTLSATVNIGLNFIFIPSLGIIGAAVTTLIAEMIMSIIAGRKAIQDYRLVVSNQAILSGFMGAIIISLICNLITLLHINSFTTVGLSFVASVFLYYFVLKFAKNPLIEMINDIIKIFIKRV